MSAIVSLQHLKAHVGVEGSMPGTQQGMESWMEHSKWNWSVEAVGTSSQLHSRCISR